MNNGAWTAEFATVKYHMPDAATISAGFRTSHTSWDSGALQTNNLKQAALSCDSLHDYESGRETSVQAVIRPNGTLRCPTTDGMLQPVKFEGLSTTANFSCLRLMNLAVFSKVVDGLINRRTAGPSVERAAVLPEPNQASPQVSVSVNLRGRSRRGLRF